jgi:hypothetical protein
MKNENIIKLDPAFIKQENFTDKKTFDNIQIQKFDNCILSFSYKTTQMLNKDLLTYYIDKNEVHYFGNITTSENFLKNFLEYQKLINQALDYIASYTKIIKKM